ncbi:TPA: hypothetical protein OT866_003483 [Klebsiella aerogenes]|nr:hypothetical protein [Klebsiella aerogenes]
MATGMKNAKSQTISTRVPHEIVEAIESVKRDGENTAAFVITAFRNEIARRQTASTGPEKVQLELNKALETLALIENIGEQAVNNARAIATMAKDELKRHQRK